MRGRGQQLEYALVRQQVVMLLLLLPRPSAAAAVDVAVVGNEEVFQLDLALVVVLEEHA